MKKNFNKIFIVLLCGFAVSALAIPVRKVERTNTPLIEEPVSDAYRFSSYHFSSIDTQKTEASYEGKVISYRKSAPAPETRGTDNNTDSAADEQYSILRFAVETNDFERLEKFMGVELHTPQYPGERFIGLVKSLKHGQGNKSKRVEVELMNLPGFVFYPGTKAVATFRFRS